MSTPYTITAFCGDYEFLNNSYPASIVWSGYDFPTLENAYQAAKTTEQDNDFLHLLDCSPAEAYRFGHHIKLRPHWDQVKLSIMTALIRQKFVMGSALAQKLVDTYPAVLIEGNDWHDNFWGSCLCPNCVNTGRNELGLLLMEQRHLLRTTTSTYFPSFLKHDDTQALS